MSQENPSNPKKSKKILFISIGIALILAFCLCLAGAVAVTQFTDIAPSLRLPWLSFLLGPSWDSSEVVPSESDFYMVVNPNLQDMSNAKHLIDVYSAVLEDTDLMKEIDDGLKEEYDISFTEDIRPWLGREIAVTIPDLEAVANNDEPDMAVIVASTSQKEVDAFLDKLRNQLEADDYDIAVRMYEGVTYYAQVVNEEWETPLVFGKLKNFVVFATSDDIMKDIIDVSEGNTDSLSKNEKYKQLIDALPSDAAAIAFYDMENLASIVLENTGTGFVPPAQTVEQTEALKAVGIALSLTNEGIALDFAVTFNPDELQILEDSQPTAYGGALLDNIPADALGFIVSQDLDSIWQKYLVSIEENPDVKQQLEDMGNQLGMTFDEELLSWATGEYTLAIIETSTSDTYLPPLGVFSIFETSDQAQAEDIMEGIVSLIQNFMYIEFYTEEINGVEMQVFQEGGVSLGYGFTPEHLVIGFTEDALSISVSEDITPISKDDTFQAVESYLPSRNSGYFYINIDSVWRLAYDNMGEYDRETFDEFLPYLEPIKALGAAGQLANPQDGIGQATIFFYIP
ncbi:MAG: DUF3352 domain-containing protein [Chloroflexota bacterium]|nr:DUF3352 domain-containing protein [Chloroflexota bacterium]